MRPNVTKSDFNPGDKVYFECRPGYRFITPGRPVFSVCQDDNTWTPLEEACTSKCTKLFFFYYSRDFTHFRLHTAVVQCLFSHVNVGFR